MDVGKKINKDLGKSYSVLGMVKTAERDESKMWTIYLNS